MADRVNNNKIEYMYDRFSDGFLSELRSDEFFAFFMNALKSGERNVCHRFCVKRAKRVYR